MWILIIQSATDLRREVTVRSETLTIGRDPDNSIVLVDRHASRRHAEIDFSGGERNPIIRDLNSTNGTFVNGQALSEPQVITEEDQIRIGTYIFTLVYGSTDKLTAPGQAHPDDTANNRLLFQSLENYAVVIYELEKALSTATDLEGVIKKTTNFISLSTDATTCRILLQEDFEAFGSLGLPQDLSPEKAGPEPPRLISEEHLQDSEKKSAIVVPVRVHTLLEAIIYAVRDHSAPQRFDTHDLQLAIAAGHQLAMVIQQKRHEKILIESINHDPLTQLPNRLYLREKIQEAINQRRIDPDHSFALLFLDLDDFKLVNDSLGHPSGDDLLVVLAKRFRSLVKPGDTIARFGGDEFAILYVGFNSAEELSVLAKSILEAVAKPVTLQGTDVHVSGTLGITTSRLDYRSANDMIRDADIAMYHAKDQGEHSFEVYNSEMREVILERISLNNDLRKAIQKHEFQLHYQPILSLVDRRIVGFEALIRWNSPHRGFVKPGRFLSKTTTTGLLRSIDDWVLQAACIEANAWQTPAGGGEPLFVSVNLSNKQIGRSDLVGTIDAILMRSGLPPDRLWLEITENTVFGNEIVAIESMLELRDLGVHFSLDDFGTGYSTFNYLYRLPIDVLKIDRTFIDELDNEVGSEKIVRVLVELGRSLGLKVVAEGIESREQYTILRNLRCDFGQGYYFSHPIPANEVEDLLRAEGERAHPGGHGEP